MSTCKVCNCEITDEAMSKIYYDEDYPSIDIGPYCQSCIGKIRICSGCHHPKIIDVDIRYFSRGNFYCTDCEQNIEMCGACGNEGTIYKTYEGKKYCESCFKQYFFECGCCNEVHPDSARVKDALTHLEYAGLFKKYGKAVCYDCFNSNHTRFKKYDVAKCDRCGKYFTDKDGSKYCPGCAAIIKPCVLCGNKHHRNVRSQGDDTLPKDPGKSSSTLCWSCMKHRVQKCEICSVYTLKAKSIRGRFGSCSVCTLCQEEAKHLGECRTCLSFRKLDDKHQCNECRNTYGKSNKCDDCGRIKDYTGRCRVCYSTSVYGYSTKPPIFFHYSKVDIKSAYTPFMGIENEVSFSGYDTMQRALKLLYSNYGPDILIAKSDSSIDGEGYEIVTQPMSLDMLHKLDMSKMFHPDQRKTSSCGMHVHVNREAFIGDTHIFKVCQFVHNNEEFMDKVAGRHYNHYNDKFLTKPSSVVKRAKDGDAGRSCRINLTNNKTVEFRMFAGCTREFEYRYRLEFVHALMCWARIVPVTMDKPKSLIQFVENNSKMYPNLHKFLQSV